LTECPKITMEVRGHLKTTTSQGLLRVDDVPMAIVICFTSPIDSDFFRTAEHTSRCGSALCNEKQGRDSRTWGLEAYVCMPRIPRIGTAIELRATSDHTNYGCMYICNQTPYGVRLAKISINTNGKSHFIERSLFQKPWALVVTPVHPISARLLRTALCALESPNEAIGS
jgi:hypothetical protein